MVEAASFAVLDLETTGFFSARVTEVAIVAGTIDQFTLFSNSLTDDILAEEEPFTLDTVHRIIDFLSTFPQPLVLLAHNGIRFDFPRLFDEIAACDGMEEWKTRLPGLQYANTISAFRDVEKDWLEDLKTAAKDYFHTLAIPLAIFEGTDDGTGPRRISMCTGCPVNSDMETWPFCDMTMRDWCFAARVRLPSQLEWTGRTVKRRPKEPDQLTGCFSLEKMFAEIFPGSPAQPHRALGDTLYLLSLILAYGGDIIRHFLDNGQTFPELYGPPEDNQPLNADEDPRVKISLS